MTQPYRRLTISGVARFPRPGTNIPGRIAFTPDSQAITYLYSAEGSLVRSLWRYDLATGERTVIAGPPPESQDEGQLSREEELRRERARLRELGVTGYQFARDASPSVLLVPSRGRLQVSAGGAPLQLIDGIEGAIDPQLSRDGTKVAYVRDGELFVADVPGGSPRQLTPGAEDALTNGLADFIHQEELDQPHGFWWSPDGSRLAYIQADARHIPNYPIVHQGKAGVDIEHHRYPFAGEPNALLKLGVVSVHGGDTTWMDLGGDTDIYVPRVRWRPDGVLTAEILSRDQKTLRLAAFNDSGRATLLHHEHQAPWLNLSHDTRFLESGEILWSSERTGFRHLYLLDARGEVRRALTGGEWMVTHVVEVDQPRRLVYFAATKESPLERHLYSVSLDGGEVQRLTEPGGWHSIGFARDGSRFIDVHSSMGAAPRVTIRHAGGTLDTVLYEDPEATAEKLGLRPPEMVECLAADGATTLFGAVYTPPELEPGSRYPIVVSVYGGPHAQRVIDEWSMTTDLRAQYLAQEGFIVFKLDNRGSANRGLEFEAALANRMGTIEVEDQAAGVRWLAQRAYADAGRVGVYGWSYGGYMTCLCLLREPALFKVGVAGAPVTDWGGYDTGYTERYMGTPQSNPDGYREGSALTHVQNLRGKLLLVHGMIDENVHFRHTGRLIVALTGAQKSYDLLVFPEERHMPRDQAGLEYQESRVIGYFQEHL